MEIELYKMKYNIGENSKDIRILGDIFVKNNINKGALIINNKKVSLKNIIRANDIKNNKIKIILNKTFIIEAACLKIVNH